MSIRVVRSGYAWRSRAVPEERSVPGEAHLGEDGLAAKWASAIDHRLSVSIHVVPSGYAWRSRAMPDERSVPGEAHLGEDGLARQMGVS